MVLGVRIREARVNLNLSQRQLAEGIVSKSFIGQIENGTAQPSFRTLVLIARRLGKPVSFFLERQDNSGLQLSEAFLQLLNDLFDGGAYEKCVDLSREVLEVCDASSHERGRNHIKLLLGKSLFKLGRIPEAASILEEVYHCSGKRTVDTIESLYWIANCHYRRGEYRLAYNKYQTVSRETQGRKRLLGIFYQSTLYLASSAFRLGNTEEAMRWYEFVYSDIFVDARTKIDAGMSLSWVLFQKGDVSKALSMANVVKRLSLVHGKYQTSAIEHNIGIYFYSMGHCGHARYLWGKVLKDFEGSGHIYQQVSVLDEIALDCLWRKEPDEAEKYALAALRLLMNVSHGVAHGRIYRTLGQVEYQRGQFANARRWYDIALQLFEVLYAQREIFDTRTLIDKVREVLNDDSFH